MSIISESNVLFGSTEELVKLMIFFAVLSAHFPSLNENILFFQYALFFLYLVGSLA